MPECAALTEANLANTSVAGSAANKQAIQKAIAVVKARTNGNECMH